jgi:hypothetical protein
MPRIIEAVDNALGQWLAEISDPKFEAPQAIIDFAKEQADGRLRELILDHLHVKKTHRTWPPRGESAIP